MKTEDRPVPVKARIHSAVVIALASLLGTSAAQAATNLYVSPNGQGSKNCVSAANACQLTVARNLVRTMNGSLNADIVVNLAAGTYNLSSTFQLKPEDSGNNGYSVIYQGPTNASTPAVLSGGMQVGGWIWHDYAKNIWRAPMMTGVGFRQLYVNGVRAVRARHPNLSNIDTGEGYLQAVSTVVPSGQTGVPDTLKFVVNTNDIPPFRKITGVEAVWIHHWKHLRARVASTTANGVETTLNFQSVESTQPVTAVYTHVPQPNAPYYFENDFKLLDQAGEWYFDPAPVAPPTTDPQVYYIPRPGEVASGAPIIIPQLETLVDISGTNSTTPVHNVQLRNLSFMYSNWNAPDAMGYGVYQGAMFTMGNGQQPVPGAVRISNADTVALENNSFSRTGAHAVLLSGKVSNYRVVRNQFSDLSGGAVYDLANPSTNGLITNNLVEKYGRAYSDAVGILAQYPKNLTISHNEVRYGGYTGISLGYWWDADDRYTNNQVLDNRVHHVVQVVDDGGGIYTYGRVPNTLFQGNHVSDITTSSAFAGALGFPPVGIYLDETSIGRTVQGNVVKNAYQSFKINNLFNDTSDNLVTGNYYDTVNLGAATTGTNVVTGNIYVAPTAALPTAAQTIVNNAGVQP